MYFEIGTFVTAIGTLLLAGGTLWLACTTRKMVEAQNEFVLDFKIVGKRYGVPPTSEHRLFVQNYGPGVVLDLMCTVSFDDEARTKTVKINCGSFGVGLKKNFYLIGETTAAEFKIGWQAKNALRSLKTGSISVPITIPPPTNKARQL